MWTTFRENDDEFKAMYDEYGIPRWKCDFSEKQKRRVRSYVGMYAWYD